MRCVVEQSEKRLRASAHHEIRRLTCDFNEGILVLRGRVSSYYLLQLSQEAVRNVGGVEVILNAVEVVPANGAQAWLVPRTNH